MPDPRPHGRVWTDLIRSLVLIAVVVGTTLLGLHHTLDSAAVTGILGAVVGAVGAAAASAVGGRISTRDE